MHVSMQLLDPSTWDASTKHPSTHTHTQQYILTIQVYTKRLHLPQTTAQSAHAGYTQLHMLSKHMLLAKEEERPSEWGKARYIVVPCTAQRHEAFNYPLHRIKA